jgi:CheY-like chemotaxis protein
VFVMVAEGTRSLLVVEDDVDVRDALEQVLTEEGYDVVAARDGVDALQLVAESPSRFCLIILDVLMPRLDGRQFLDRARSALRRTPVLLFSAGQLPPELLSDPCVVGVIPKPVDVAFLLEKVAAHCELESPARQAVGGGRRS